MAEIKLINEVPGLVREFASYKFGIQGCSVKTVEEYLFDLRTFFRYIYAARNSLPLPQMADEESAPDISGLDRDFVLSVATDEIYEFLMYAGSGRGNAWAAKSRKLSAIKSLYTYLSLKRNLIEVSPAANIDAPKPKKQLPKYLSLEESLEVLKAVQEDQTSKTTVRDFAIITLFLNCGMRLSELAGINMRDIDRDLRSLRVLGKGSKERVIYLNDACRSAVGAHLTVRIDNARPDWDKNALFVSGRGGRISVKTVQWMVKKYFKLAGFENKNYSVHKLRHTAATLLYQTGNVDIRVLKDILGHEQLNTTQIYTHVSNASMQSAMEQNPLSKVKSGVRGKD